MSLLKKSGKTPSNLPVVAVIWVVAPCLECHLSFLAVFLGHLISLCFAGLLNGLQQPVPFFLSSLLPCVHCCRRAPALLNPGALNDYCVVRIVPRSACVPLSSICDVILKVPWGLLRDCGSATWLEAASLVLQTLDSEKMKYLSTCSRLRMYPMTFESCFHRRRKKKWIRSIICCRSTWCGIQLFVKIRNGCTVGKSVQVSTPYRGTCAELIHPSPNQPIEI